MNKKILSIFVMIMALSLFGVSCSSNNKDKTGPDGNNGGGDTTTTLKEADLESWLKSIPKTDVVDSAVFDFSKGTYATGTLSVVSTGATDTVTVANVKDKVIASLKAVDQTKFKIKTTLDTAIFSGGDAGGATALVAAFEIEPASASYVFDEGLAKLKVSLSLTVNDGKNWK